VEKKTGSFGNNSMVISNSIFLQNTKKNLDKGKKFRVKIEHDKPPVSIEIQKNHNLMG